MALNDISLTAGMRSNLISLQNTTTLLDRTQQRLSTGKKVNTALDNPTNFFAAQGHTQRAADLTTRKDGMSEAIQGVRAANDGITGITALIEAAKGLTQSARSADRTGRDNLAAQFNTMLTQIDQLAGDSGYKGKNFLKADSLQVLFNESGGSFLTIQGFSATSAGMSVTSLTVGTADIITSGLSGGTGAQTADTAIHTATLSTVANSNNVSTGTTFSMTAGTFTVDATMSGFGGATGAGATYTGLFIDVAGNSALMATGTDYRNLGLNNGVSGGYTITNVYVNGKLLNGANWSATGIGSTSGLAGESGGVYLQIASGVLTGTNANTVIALTGATSLSITYDIQVQGHLDNSSNAAAANLYVYDLAAGDTSSGLSVVGLDASTNNTALTGFANHTGVSGAAVYVSGVIADPATYTISGTQIIFTTSGAPSLTTGAIQYNYNTGFSALTGPNVTRTSAFTTVSLSGAGTTITDVKLNGVSNTNWHASGNSIVFASGYEPAAGDQVTYTVTVGGATGSWALDAGIDTSVNQLDAALSTLRTQTAALASNLSVVNIRQDFTSNLVNDLLKGADNLTLADTNEEGANMLMLQTRQQLSTTSLKMASDAAQAVLRLF